MSVVIDFEGLTLDGTEPGLVPYVAFDALGVSEAFVATARVPAEEGDTRQPPNPVYNFSEDVQLSLDGEDWEEWGDGLDDVGYLPAQFHIRFRRVLDGEQIDLTDCIGMMGNNIIEVEGFATGTGTTVTIGSGTAAQIQPALGAGVAWSAGDGTAAQVNPAVGTGTTVSVGVGSAVEVGAPQPATGEGLTTSAGVGTAAQVQPAVGAGTTASAGSGAAAQKQPAVGTGTTTSAASGAATAYNPLAQVGTVTPTAGDGQVALDWADVTNATGYTIERCIKATDPGSGSWSSETGYASTTSSTSDKTITGLTNGSKYWFRVKATASGYIDGAWSASVSGTPVSASQNAKNARITAVFPGDAVHTLYARETDPNKYSLVYGYDPDEEYNYYWFGYNGSIIWSVGIAEATTHIRLEFSDTTYTVSYSTDNGSSWTTDRTGTNSSKQTAGDWRVVTGTQTAFVNLD